MLRNKLLTNRHLLLVVVFVTNLLLCILTSMVVLLVLSLQVCILFKIIFKLCGNGCMFNVDLWIVNSNILQIEVAKTSHKANFFYFMNKIVAK